MSVAYLAKLGGGISLNGADLLAQLLVGLLLVFLDRLRETAGASQLILGQAEFLRGDFQFRLQVGDARIGLTEFLVDSLGLFVSGI